MKIGRKQRIVMTGDSITDANRARPIGDGMHRELGDGYVALVDSILRAARPDYPVHVINTGVGGDTTRQLLARWEQDVVALNPDWVSLMIGVNDVWRQFDHPLSREHHVGIEEFEANLQKLIGPLRPRLKGLVLMTPYLIESNRQDAMRQMVDAYGDVVRRLAGALDAILVDTQSAMDKALLNLQPIALTYDRVHPNWTGNMILAREFLSAVGFHE